VAVSWSALRRAPADDRWRRRNYRGHELTMLLGPAVGAGALIGVAAAGPRARPAALAVMAATAAVGAYDDRYGDRHARGLAGHARALRAGRLTTGMVKLIALVGTAAVASAVRRRGPVDLALDTVLVAGGANLVNLFDLRPGRAAKATLLVASGLGCTTDRQARATAAAAAGAALAVLPSDLAEHAMLGDCGAGTLGALLGWAAAIGGSRRRRALLAAAVVGLTLASERVSFSAVIDGHPALRAVDRLGRQAA
jgi:UDP-N-acetylmuramyl pentapeptide phosphotransferase/UDP-N-acetylglucosamine-1-phosphate transferase